MNGATSIEFQALYILGLLLHLPNGYVTAKANHLLHASQLGKLLAGETRRETLVLDARGRIQGSQTCAEELRGAHSSRIDSASFGQNVLHLHGYSLSSIRGSGVGQWTPRMVENKTSLFNFRRLMMAVQMASPVIVHGGVGCGKSFMVRELAAATGQDANLIELHLDDQTDSKTLIGTYVCSDVPGEFVWQAGVITQAATQGHWLILEDIDKVSLEVIAALAPLLERRRLYMPHRGEEVPVHPSFRLFGTMTVTMGIESSLREEGLAQAKRLALPGAPSLRHFSHNFLFVSISLPSQAEVMTILDVKFPSLGKAAKRLILDTYRLFSGGGQTKPPTQGEDVVPDSQKYLRMLAARQFTLRDLMKVAKRVERFVAGHNKGADFLTAAQTRVLFNEVVDVFVGSARRVDLYRLLVRQLGEVWGLSEDDAYTAVLDACPESVVTTAGVTIGRGTVAAVAGRSDSGVAKQQFAHTKHSRRVLERVAVCAAMDEPVLLVGETGSGKTTSVQELADMTSRKLVVQNLSLSTDSSDLLGGFRPVTMRQLFQPSYVLFASLFRETYDVTQNADFLQVVSQLFNDQQWRRLLKAFLKASDNARGKVGAILEKQGGRR